MSNLTRRQFLRVSAVATAGAVLAACGKKETATEIPVAVTTSKPVEKATEAPRVRSAPPPGPWVMYPATAP
jgi:hypothetical protein